MLIKYIDMIHVKILRHSERFDYTYPIFWLFYFGYYWADAPLTSHGHFLAYEKGKEIARNHVEFNPKYIYTSPYSRTLETSTQIKKSFPNSEIIIETLLAEYQPNYAHKISLYPDGIPTIFGGNETNFSYPETYEEFTNRVDFIISKLIEKKSDLIIITHGEVLKTYVNLIQELYPELILEPGITPYLTVLSFDYDYENDVIVEDSIKIE